MLVGCSGSNPQHQDCISDVQGSPEEVATACNQLLDRPFEALLAQIFGVVFIGFCLCIWINPVVEIFKKRSKKPEKKNILKSQYKRDDKSWEKWPLIGSAMFGILGFIFLNGAFGNHFDLLPIFILACIPALINYFVNPND